ncbi:HNH endonuclease signature motif containing protein [Mangrovihabitans endophyticus]|uniref:HNH endonuclease n=1 Tax=Mangrovihabitans endophyticus TaxID=1751298 RepID=A0A8J3C2X1_9ACTN|nr:HNH endonuclease signature motif containing protein [Mangrovihabitans endophyticus]GGL00512.1 HNH endonuclease [Mangrovihabitans endophyticus]
MLQNIRELATATAKVAAAPLWSMPDEQLIEALNIAHRLEQSAAALTAHIVHQIDARGIAARDGYRGTASWLRDTLRLDPHAARNLAALAAGLQRHRDVDRAFSAGQVHDRQAMAIIEAVDALPDVAGVPAVDAAESAMVEWSTDLAPSPLRRLGEHILEYVAPDRACEAAEETLRRQEERARRRRGLSWRPPVDGLVRVFGHLTVEDAAVLRAAVDPMTAPRRDGTPTSETEASAGAQEAAGPAPSPVREMRSPAQRRADALTEICRQALRRGDLPESGGEPPQIAVTMRYDPLARAVSRARLDTGESLSARTARRLACDARIVPMVLGGAGQVLDAGRSRRLVTGALRRALVVRDQGCAFPGCDRPPRWCDGHHIRHWVDGGRTDLDNLVLLCPHHHRLIHDGDWEIQRGADGQPDFIPPRRIDRAQRPRRNVFHART